MSRHRSLCPHRSLTCHLPVPRRLAFGRCLTGVVVAMGWALAAMTVLTVLLATSPRAVAGPAEDFAATLAPAQRTVFQAWHVAQRAHDARVDAYWSTVDTKRAARRRKKADDVPLVAADYVATFPPSYEGPQLPAGIAGAWSRFLAERDKDNPPAPEREIPGLSVYLDAARKVYDFVPERLSERAFKARYADEAIRRGLTKDQVVRIYALETGGIGTAEMQAGINPLSGKGRPISSALGYAQLLDANSVNEVAKHGEYLLARLKAMAAEPDLPPERVAQLTAKRTALAAMVRNARSVPFDWSRHQQYARTQAGQGIHALNLDGDVGPILQTVKLHGLAVEAEKAGKGALTGAEMELMNLAGPGTGLEILLNPPAAAAPTTNFFTRRAYGVNKMVQGLTGSGLLAELQRRMDLALDKSGTRELAAAFDALVPPAAATTRQAADR